ncbi:MAG: SIR2 family protein, partial [Halobacteriaceae archaeon]
MVDARMSLTFSVRNNPGRYALLLGSGVSTEAGIPTGWTVVSKLAQRVAATEGTPIDDDTDPTDWYEETYDEPATYENLIEGLARTQTERRSLLEDFFEPTEEEAERGEKTPTDAHESIAWLVDKGYIDVILTTNFDQLLEQALRDQGVNPVVISGEESARGAEPLQHQDAVVVKVNGDYKQTNVKNLSSELESYSEPIQRIIDRVFQEYGLIVCGWSGEYDTRLRQSLQECETHRYSTYWTYYSNLGDIASELVAHRDGFTIPHDGAISFFTDLQDRVQALADAKEGESLTTPIARERAKRYLPREEHQIDLTDLIRETAERAGKNVQNEERFPLSGGQLDDDFSVEDRYRTYGNLTQTIVAVVMTCAYWGGDTVNSGEDPISDSLSTLSPSQSPTSQF